MRRRKAHDLWARERGNEDDQSFGPHSNGFQRPSAAGHQDSSCVLFIVLCCLLQSAWSVLCIEAPRMKGSRRELNVKPKGSRRKPKKAKRKLNGRESGHSESKAAMLTHRSPHRVRRLAPSQCPTNSAQSKPAYWLWQATLVPRGPSSSSSSS